MNLGGDGRDTYPFIGSTGSFYDNTHYDISKLYQWNIVLNHMQNKGIATHMVLAETEAGNSEWLDGGELGVERKLFYREMIARFSYLLGVKWNLSEESRFGTARHKAFAAYIKSQDWAAHPIAVHSYLNRPQETYDDLLGDPLFDASSIQFSPSNANDFVETWRAKTAAAGKPWVIDMDEVGSAQTGLTDENADSLRRSVLYPVYFSGGNIEWYFGYHPLPLGGDMRTEDFRTRAPMYRYMKYAREMMQSQLPFAEMKPADELHSTPGAQVFAKASDTYAVFIANGNQSGTLEIEPGTYRQRWFNPRTGAFEGNVQIVSTTPLTLGVPPNTPGQDWVIVLDQKINDLTLGNLPANSPDQAAEQAADGSTDHATDQAQNSSQVTTPSNSTTPEQTDNNPPAISTDTTTTTADKAEESTTNPPAPNPGDPVADVAEPTSNSNTKPAKSGGGIAGLPSLLVMWILTLLMASRSRNNQIR